jgi:hypothetical protein
VNGRNARWAWLAGLALASAVASPVIAAPLPLVTAPPGWHTEPEHASALAQRFARTAPFGALPATTAAEAYVSDKPDVALFATRATATLSEPTLAASAARLALDDLRASSRRASLAGGVASEESWHETIESSPPQVTATLRWTDPGSHAVEDARMVVASDGARIVAVTGECIASDTADAGRVAACRAALASLEPGIPAARRVALTPATGDRRAQPQMSATPSPTAREAPRLDDGSRFALPPITIPQAPRSDDRLVYLGAGVIVLAGLFWWNRQRRDRFDREDRDERTAPPRDDDDDADDADDLHAAARGDGPDRPEGHSKP